MNSDNTGGAGGAGGIEGEGGGASDGYLRKRITRTQKGFKAAVLSSADEVVSTGRDCTFHFERASLLERAGAALVDWFIFQLFILVISSVVKFTSLPEMWRVTLSTILSSAIWNSIFLKWKHSRSAIVTPGMSLFRLNLVENVPDDNSSAIYSVGPKLFVVYHLATGIVIPKLLVKFQLELFYLIDLLMLATQQSTVCEYFFNIQYVRARSIKKISVDEWYPVSQSFVENGCQHFVSTSQGGQLVDLTKSNPSLRTCAWFCDFIAGSVIYNIISLLRNRWEEKAYFSFDGMSYFFFDHQVLNIDGETSVTGLWGFINRLRDITHANLGAAYVPLKLNQVSNVVSISFLKDNLSKYHAQIDAMIWRLFSIDDNFSLPSDYLLITGVLVAVGLALFRTTGYTSIGQYVVNLKYIDGTKVAFDQQFFAWKVLALPAFDNIYFLLLPMIALYHPCNTSNITSVFICYYLVNLALLVGSSTTLGEWILQIQSVNWASGIKYVPQKQAPKHAKSN